MRKGILLCLLVSCITSFATEREYLNYQQRLETAVVIPTRVLKKNDVFLCKQITKQKYLTKDQDPKTIDWIYSTSITAIKVYRIGRTHGFEFTSCKNRDTRDCREQAKATIYFRDKIKFDSQNLLKLKALPGELLFTTKSDEVKSAFDTFSKDSSLGEDFVDVFTFGFAPAYEQLRSIGSGKIIRQIKESIHYCIH